MASSTSRKPGKKPGRKSDCVIPPSLPHEALPALMFKRDDEETRQIADYVEWQARGKERVTHAEKIATERAAGQKYEAWDVHTDKERWWVITPPTNLYSQKLFPSLDYTISFHIGLMARVMSKREPAGAPVEQALLRAEWRRWEQAAQALDQADEVEEIQAVGMRCRECLIAMVKRLGRIRISSPGVVPRGQDAPKGSDVVHWCELIADYVAQGSSASEVRGYLKAISSSAWQLVNRVTHSSTVTKHDGEIAIKATEHVLEMFAQAVFRRICGPVVQCPDCGSWKIRFKEVPAAAGAVEAEPLLAGVCDECGWGRDAGAA
jgi:hypothetical protein